VFTKKFY